MYITRPVEFSVFPTTLLLLTLFRLALNISSSRLILLNGNTGTSAAGDVIEAFGNFVVGGNYIIGAVIFLVLIAIQYVVINHGAVRISEVTARFTLDAMPGKQMSIDSDLNAGLIDEAEARHAPQAARRRSRVLRRHGRRFPLHPARRRRQHSDHQHQHHRRIPDRRAAARHGPAARARNLHRPDHRRRPGDRHPRADDLDLGRPDRHPRQFRQRAGTDVRKQLFSNPQPLLLAAGVLMALAAFPGPAEDPVSAAWACGSGTSAWKMRQKAARREAKTAADAARRGAEGESGSRCCAWNRWPSKSGSAWCRLVEGGAESPLLRRIGAIRRQLATDLGYLLPPVRVTDNLSCVSREYIDLLKGVEIARYELPQGCELAIPAGK